MMKVRASITIENEINDELIAQYAEMIANPNEEPEVSLDDSSDEEFDTYFKDNINDIIDYAKNIIHTEIYEIIDDISIRNADGWIKLEVLQDN